MTRLDSQDGSSGGQDRGAGQNGSGGQVCGNTNVLEDTGGGDHGRGVGEAKVVRAGLDGLGTSLGDGTLEELHVGLLGLTDVLQVGDLLLVEAKGGKLVVGELGETLLVERGLKPLQGQGAIDGRISL